MTATTLISALALAWTGLAVPPQDGDSPEPSVQTSVLVRVACDPRTMSVSETGIMALLDANVVADAVSDIVGRPVAFAGEKMGRFIFRAGDGSLYVFRVRQISDSPGAEGVPAVAIVQFALTAAGGTGPDAPPLGREQLAGLVEHLRRRLGEIYEVTRQHSERFIHDAEREVAQAQERLMHLQDQARELESRAEAVARHLEAGSRLEEIERRVHELRMEVAARHARKQALEQQIAELTARQQEREEPRMLERELARLVELREQALDQVQRLVEVGRASDADVARKLEELTLARIRLAEHRLGAASGPTRPETESLNSELIHLAVDLVELESRLAQAEEQREQAALEAKALAEADVEQRALRAEIDRLRGIEVPMAQHRFDQALARQAELSRLIKAAPPEVTIIGAPS